LPNYLTLGSSEGSGRPDEETWERLPPPPGSSAHQLSQSLSASRHAALGLSQPCSISRMFENWSWGISKEMKPLVLLGAATSCWSLWLYYKNDIVFERKPNPSPA
jgi:hypothetical protein